MEKTGKSPGRPKGSKNKVKPPHDPYDVQLLLQKAQHINMMLKTLRVWFTKNPYPTELYKLSWLFAAGSKKFGGIAQIWSELEAEGIVELNLVEGSRSIYQTVMMTEFKEKDETA